MERRGGTISTGVSRPGEREFLGGYDPVSFPPFAGAVDADLLNGLEGRDVITQVADDLYDVFTEGREPPRQRYPG